MALLEVVRTPARVTAVVCFCALVHGSEPQTRQERTGLIVGVVVDASSGKPVSGAIVALRGGAPMPMRSGVPPFPRILTGPDGRFVYRDLPRGTYNITATKSGYIDGAHGRRRPGGAAVPLALEEGDRAADAVIRLWKLGAITGTVLDEAGEPVVRATVRAWRRTFDRGRYVFLGAGNGVTDDRGVYRLDSLMPGEYIVGVPALQVSAAAGPRERFVFSPSSSATSNRTSIRLDQGLSVHVQGSPTPPPPADGRVALYPTIWHPSVSTHLQAASIAVASGQERDGIDLQLHPVLTARVSGSITRADGSVTALPIALIPAGEEIQNEGFQTASDGTGRFVFPAVPAGQYVLRVNAALGTAQNATSVAFFWADVPLAVAESDVDDVIVAIEGGVRIHGRLEFEGSRPPPPNRMGPVPLLVEPIDRRLTFPPPSLPVDAGQFTSGVYPPGRYLVRVSGSPIGWMFKSATYNGRDVSQTPIDLVKDDVYIVLTYTDRWTGLAGTVLGADGRPDPDAIVLLFPTDAKLWWNYGASPRRLKGARTRKNGEYNFTSVPPGAYHVVALPDEDAADWMDPRFLEAASRVATAIRIGDGEQKISNLRTQEIK